MLDMTLNDNDRQSFITNIINENGELKIKYANGNIDSIYNSKHNLEVCRYRLEKQVKKYADKYLDRTNIQAIMVYIKRYSFLISSLLGLYYTYNIDIHIILKILITLFIIGANLFSFLVKEIHVKIIQDCINEVFASQYFLDNKEKYSYDTEEGKKYALNIEDIAKFNLDEEQLKKILSTVEELKQNSEGLEGIKLDFKNKITGKDNHIII